MDKFTNLTLGEGEGHSLAHENKTPMDVTSENIPCVTIKQQWPKK